MDSILPSPAAVPDARDFTDTLATRKSIYDSVLTAAQQVQPLTNTRHSLALSNVHYIDPERFSRAQRKQAVLTGQSLGRRMRGTWTLKDTAGNQVDQRTMVVGQVPYLSSSGVFTTNGVDQILSNQLRLRPGSYARRKDNGELESHVNILPGQGLSHRYSLEPETGRFYINVAQSKIPLIPLLRAAGATDSELRDAWSQKILSANYSQDNPASLRRLAQQFLPEGFEGDVPKALWEKFEKMPLDPEVAQRTLGAPYAKLDKSAILAATRKLLAVHNNEADVDDRDGMPNQVVVGPEDLFAERIKADSGAIRRRAFWKASFRNSLKNLPSGLLTDQLNTALMRSGLGHVVEEVNPLELLDKQSLVTRMGEGGLASVDAIPAAARDVQPTHLGFIDAYRTPESLRAGVDLYLASGARKGKDGQLYAQFRDPRTGKTDWHAHKSLADKVIAFPDWMKGKAKRVPVIRNGRHDYAKKGEVDLVMPYFERGFSPVGSMVPLKSAMSGQRVAMASRMLTQALAIPDGEAPLVQTAVPDEKDKSFEELYSDKVGALRAQKGGKVVSVDADSMQVKYDDGTQETHDLYNNFPYARKSYIHQTSNVKAGDRFEPGQLLARSNYTDKSGVTAIGRNLRTAYIPYPGNFEDANVVSESAAKKLAAEEMFQYDLEADDNTKQTKKSYVSLFPARFDRKILNDLDDDGVIKPGMTVQKGQPLVLAARARDEAYHKVHKPGQKGFSDASLLWEHEAPGVVTDVVKTEKGPVVAVKAIVPLQVGDKISGRHGDKGVIAAIVPDDQMPRDRDGNPYEMLLNSAGVVSRNNSSQVFEAVLSSIARKTGKPYKIRDFEDIEDLAQWVQTEAEKNGVQPFQHLIDPETGRKTTAPVLTGERFMMRLHHMAEDKGKGRGSGEGYTAEETPSKGGETGGKRVGLLEGNALLSHGAFSVLRDAHLLRGQRNDQYWLQFMQGHTPVEPKETHVYAKLFALMKAAGINSSSKGGSLSVMALRDKDIDQLSEGRELKNADTVDWSNGLKPIKGGLFDEGLTGGHGANKWAHIKLAEPLPSPVFEEPIRKILGLTEKQFESVMGGKEEFRGQTGPRAIRSALENLDVDKELSSLRYTIQHSRGQKRDTAARKLGYLKAAQRLDIHPKDWIISKAPVLPPLFRPINLLGNTGAPMVSDANLLYQELFEANKTLRELQPELGEDGVKDERLAAYKALKAVTGLGDPVSAKLQEKGVKGVLANVFGKGGPKTSMLQRKLLSATVDNVGRGVVIPNADLDMDHIGIPEEKAWTLYKNFVVRRLVRRGMPIAEALQEVKDKTPRAREEMTTEMEARPVLMNRAPVWHKYGTMAFWPKLVKHNSLEVSPLIVKGFNMDFDGDAVQYHVPVADDAKDEAIERMLPSRNLISIADMKSPMHMPSREFLGGLYEASTAQKKGRPRVFRDGKAVLMAYLNGEIDAGDPVSTLNDD